MVPLKRTPKLVFTTNVHLMEVKSIAECSKGSILRYFRPPLTNHFPLGLVLSIFKWLLKTGFTVTPQKASEYVKEVPLTQTTDQTWHHEDCTQKITWTNEDTLSPRMGSIDGRPMADIHMPLDSNVILESTTFNVIYTP